MNSFMASLGLGVQSVDFHLNFMMPYMREKASKKHQNTQTKTMGVFGKKGSLFARNVKTNSKYYK